MVFKLMSQTQIGSHLTFKAMALMLLELLKIKSSLGWHLIPLFFAYIFIAEIPTNDIFVPTFENTYSEGTDIITCSVASTDTGFLTDTSTVLISRIPELRAFLVLLQQGKKTDSGLTFQAVRCLETWLCYLRLLNLGISFPSKYSAKVLTVISQALIATGYTLYIYDIFDLLIFGTCSKLMVRPEGKNICTAILFPAAGHCVGYYFL